MWCRCSCTQLIFYHAYIQRAVWFCRRTQRDIIGVSEKYCLWIWQRLCGVSVCVFAVFHVPSCIHVGRFPYVTRGLLTRLLGRFLTVCDGGEEVYILSKCRIGLYMCHVSLWQGWTFALSVFSRGTQGPACVLGFNLTLHGFDIQRVVECEIKNIVQHRFDMLASFLDRFHVISTSCAVWMFTHRLTSVYRVMS